jgi:hypothetical protein
MVRGSPSRGGPLSPTLPQSKSFGISENVDLKNRVRQKRIARIYTGFCDYLMYRLVRKQLLTVGYSLEKLQENNRGKVSRVSVGVDVENACVWWDHGMSRHYVLFKDMVRIDYGHHSAVYRNIQSSKFSSDSIQRKVAPWNCFSIITNSRSFDFYASPVSSSTTTPGNSIEIENLLFGISYVILNELKPTIKLPPIGGLFKDKKQLTLIRGRIKLNHVMGRPGGRGTLIGSVLLTSFEHISESNDAVQQSDLVDVIAANQKSLGYDESLGDEEGEVEEEEASEDERLVSILEKRANNLSGESTPSRAASVSSSQKRKEERDAFWDINSVEESQNN